MSGSTLEVADIFRDRGIAWRQAHAAIMARDNWWGAISRAEPGQPDDQPPVIPCHYCRCSRCTDQSAGHHASIQAQFCDAFVRGGLRYSYSTGAAGHKDVRTTMIYTHVLNRGGMGVKSPLELLLD